MAHDNIDPAVAREITIPELVSRKFEPYIKASDLKNLGARDQEVLLVLSVLEQQNQWCMEALVNQNRHLRLIEAEIIKSRNNQRSSAWQYVVARWAAVITGAAILSALGQRMFKAMWP